jgi:hypothetical protein
MVWPLIDTCLTIDAARCEGANNDLDWTCASPSLPGGKDLGLNHYLLKDGLITTLTTALKQRA